MKRFLLFFALTAVLSAADINGVWSFNIVSFGEEIAPARVTFHVEGNKLTGTLNELKLDGTAEPGGALKFTANRPDGQIFGTFEGQVQGDQLSGTAKRDKDTFTWKARRIVAPAAGP